MPGQSGIWQLLNSACVSAAGRAEPSPAACAFISRRAAQAGLKAKALRRHESSEYGSSTSLETATSTNWRTTIKYRVSINLVDLYRKDILSKSRSPVKCEEQFIAFNDRCFTGDILRGSNWLALRTETLWSIAIQQLRPGDVQPNCFPHVLESCKLTGSGHAYTLMGGLVTIASGFGKQKDQSHKIT